MMDSKQNSCFINNHNHDIHGLRLYIKWRMPESNRRPYECKSYALPTELIPRCFRARYQCTYKQITSTLIRSLLLPALSWKIIPQCQNYHFRQSYCVHGRPQTTKSHTSNLLPAERPVGLRTSHGIQPLFSSTLLPICQPTLKIFNNALVAFLYILHELF